MIDYKERISNIFINSSSTVSDYYLDLNNSELSKGMVINKVLEVLSEKERDEFFNELYLDDNDLKTIFFNKYKGVRGNSEVSPIEFKNSVEYKNFMNKSFRKDYVQEDSYKYDELVLFSSIFDHISSINSNENSRIEDVLFFVEDVFDSNKSEEVKQNINEHNIVKEQSSENNSLTPELIDINQGKIKFLTSSDINLIFPDFLKLDSRDIVDLAIPLDNDSNGDKMYNFIAPLTNNFLAIENSDNAETDQFDFSNKTNLLTKENTNLSFGEIKTTLNSYLKDDIFLDENLNDELNENGKVLKEFNKTILNLMGVYQNNIQLSKISSDPSLFMHNEKIRYIFSKHTTMFLQSVVNKNKSKTKRSKLYKIFTLPDNLSDNEVTSDEENVSGNDLPNFSHTTLLKAFKADPKSIKEALEVLNEKGKELMNDYRMKIKTSQTQTNIPIIKSTNGNNYPKVDIDKELLKIILGSISKGKAIHVHSDPGTGKTMNIKAIFDVLGFKSFELKVSVDPETYVKNLGDDDKPIIGEKGTQDSVVKKAADFGGYFYLFADEYGNKIFGLKDYGLGEAANGSLDKLQKAKKGLFIGASNYGFTHSDKVVNSTKDRHDEYHLDTKNWEEPDYIHSRMLYLHFNNFAPSFDVSNSRMFTSTMKQIKKNEIKVFKKYFELVEDEEYAPLLEKFYNVLENYDFSSEKFNELIQNIEEFSSDEPEKYKQIILNSNLIKEYFNFKSVITKIENDEKLKDTIDKTVEKSIKKNKDMSPEEKEIFKIVETTKLKEIEKSKEDFQLILNYLKTDKLNIDSIPHPSDINNIVEFMEDFIEGNREILYSKFYFDITTDSDITLSKEKIKFILNQVIHTYNINSSSLISSEEFMNRVSNTLPNLNSRLNLINVDYKQSIQDFNNSNLLNTLPLNANKNLASTLLFNKQHLERFKTKKFIRRNVEFESSLFFTYDYDSEKEPTDVVSTYKMNEVNKVNDMIGVLSTIASETNKYIRRDVQNLNDEHEFDDIEDFNPDAESINKFFYRNLDNLLKELYSGLNASSGTSIPKMFDKFFRNIEVSLPEGYMDTILLPVLEQLKDNKNIQISNSGGFIPNMES